MAIKDAGSWPSGCPQECTQCFAPAVMLSLSRSWYGYNCECMQCGHLWTEAFRWTGTAKPGALV